MSTDDQLIDAALAGDSAALADIWDRHRGRLKRMVRLRMDPRLYGRIDSSDVLQETFLAVHRQVPNFPRGKMSVFLWLRRLAGQTLVDLHRHHLGAQKRNAGREISLFRGFMPHATSAAIAAQLLGKVTTASQAAARSELKLQVQEALNLMSSLDREVLALRHFEGLSNAEISELLEISENAASNRYVRALRRLKEVLSAIMVDSDFASW
jgi:RNA polymerase sigma-70 factor (ECF subfamily)